jgi:hypothetical protein
MRVITSASIVTRAVERVLFTAFAGRPEDWPCEGAEMGRRQLALGQVRYSLLRGCCAA